MNLGLFQVIFKIWLLVLVISATGFIIFQTNMFELIWEVNTKVIAYLPSELLFVFWLISMWLMFHIWKYLSH